MPIDRSADRNIHFFDDANPDVCLGGLIQNGSVTEANFLDMVGIIVLTEGPVQIRERTSGRVVMRTNEPLGLGEYNIFRKSYLSSPSGHFDAPVMASNAVAIQ